jgi:DNA-binding response OmpR family regulator
LRILLADDERDTVDTLTMVLEDEGHQVRGLYGAGEVAHAMRDFRPQVVVLDIAMPGKSGYDLAREIRGAPGGEVPLLIAISGRYQKGSDRLLSQMVGFDHHLPKPCDLHALLALLTN